MKVHLPDGAALDDQYLFEAIGEPGEHLDNFALRIGPALRAFSDVTGYEACGVLATDGDRFGAIVGSSRSHVACASYHRRVPTGMRSTGQTIHSHGRERGFNANRNDRVLHGALLAGTPGPRGVSGQRLDAFSAMDYSDGPGYLATPTGVIHQHAPGTSRVVHSNELVAGTDLVEGGRSGLLHDPSVAADSWAQNRK